MADFAVWVIAAEPVLDWPPGTFLAAYTRNRASAHELALESASIVRPLLGLPVPWTGTAAELLERLVTLAGDKVVRHQDWPAGARALSGQLRRLAPDLRSIGVEVTFETRSGQRRPITIAQGNDQGAVPSSASPPSPVVRKGHEPHDGHDGRDGPMPPYALANDDGWAGMASGRGPTDVGPDRHMPANDDGLPEDGPPLSWDGWDWTQGPAATVSKAASDASRHVR